MKANITKTSKTVNNTTHIAYSVDEKPRYDWNSDTVKIKFSDEAIADKHNYAMAIPFEMLEKAYLAACKSKRIKPATK